MSPTMRAKMKINQAIKTGDSVTLNLSAVAAKSYPADGSDEDNTFAKHSPSASLSIVIMNPALLDKFEAGQTFYVDFTLVGDAPTE